MEFLGDGVMLSLYGAILGIVMLGVGLEVLGEAAASNRSVVEAESAPAEILEPVAHAA